MSGTDDDTGADSDADADADAYTDVGSLAAGLEISKIVAYQSVEIPLMEDWSSSSSDYADLVKGKDALLRVFVKRQSSWTARTVRAVLEMDGTGVAKGTRLFADKAVSADSSNSALSSTFNFTIFGKYLSGDFAYRVSLVDVDDSGSGTQDRARWPDTGMATLDEKSTDGPLRLVIVPIEYNADGSGRLPDTGNDMLDAVRDLFYKNYPIAYDDIKITISDSLSWNDPVDASGDGWDSLLYELSYYKNRQGSSAQEYYYGLFVPSTSLQSYCRQGCVAGLGYVPWSARDGEFKVAIGLGFDPETAASTMIHEVGHNHGRNHAPCGDVDGVDAAFPYSDGSIGIWGYDLLSGALKSPQTHTDFMGYCDNQWVSDYTLGGLFEWIRDTNALASVRGAKTYWRSVHTDRNGQVRIGRTLTLDTPPVGEAVTVFLYDIQGVLADTVTGYFTPHLPLLGGTVLFEEPSDDVFYVSIENTSPIAL